MSIIHASACVLGRSGILVRGPSGSGKSLLMRTLLDIAYTRNRFACWIGDDQVEVTGVHQRLIARPVATIAGQAELRFSGIHAVAHRPAALIDMVVDICPAQDLERMPRHAEIAVEGISLRHLLVPKEHRSHACAIVDAHLFT